MRIIGRVCDSWLSHKTEKCPISCLRRNQRKLECSVCCTEITYFIHFKMCRQVNIISGQVCPLSQLPDGHLSLCLRVDCRLSVLASAVLVRQSGESINVPACRFKIRKKREYRILNKCSSSFTICPSRGTRISHIVMRCPQLAFVQVYVRFKESGATVIYCIANWPSSDSARW